MKLKSLESIIKPSGISFDEVKHAYTIEGTSTLYTGCTAISDAWKKEFIASWYAKEAIIAVREKILELTQAVTDMDSIRVDELLEEAKGSAARKSKEAMRVGKIAHGMIQQKIEVDISGVKSKVSPSDSEEANNAFKSFIGWEKDKNVQWLASEEVISSHEFKIAGTLDALAVLDGIPTIVDFKTSSQISESALIQLAGYDIMLTEMGFPTRQWLVLRVPKDGKPAEDIIVNDPVEMDFYRKTFLHLREAHKFFVYANSHKKDMGGKMITNKQEVKQEPKVKKLRKQRKNVIINETHTETEEEISVKDVNLTGKEDESKPIPF